MSGRPQGMQLSGQLCQAAGPDRRAVCRRTATRSLLQQVQPSWTLLIHVFNAVYTGHCARFLRTSRPMCIYTSQTTRIHDKRFSYVPGTCVSACTQTSTSVYTQVQFVLTSVYTQAQMSDDTNISLIVSFSFPTPPLARGTGPTSYIG